MYKVLIITKYNDDAVHTVIAEFESIRVAELALDKIAGNPNPSAGVQVVAIPLF